MGRLMIAIMPLMAFLCVQAGETNMAEVEALQKRVHDLENEIKRISSQMKTEKWGLCWQDCPEAFESESENKIPILAEVPGKAIKNNDGKPTHILIEGDNYHALTCLNFTHRGKIDVIYIDPPYNTGSDGFTYKDRRYLEKFPDGTTVPKDHPLRHSYWLSFMEKRLRLAKELLRDTGVIFMSINEEEYANLKLLADKIFLESNYLTTFTIKVRHEDRILKGDKPIHEVTEFLLMYRKSPKYEIQKRTVDNSSPAEYRYEIKELTATPKQEEMGGRKVQVFQPGQYEIVKTTPSFAHLKKINIRGSIKAGNSSGRFHMEHLEPLRDKFNVLYKVEGIGDDGRGYRYFLSRANARKVNGSYFQGAPLNREDEKKIPYPNFFDFESDFNVVGTEGGVPFDGGKKPVEFLKKIFQIATLNQNAIYLDFFAGSGSVLQAVAEMNEDGGHRRVLLVQNADCTYELKKGKKVALPGCSNVFTAGYEHIVDITRQRCFNVINGYVNKGKTSSEELLREKLSLTSFKPKNAEDLLERIEEARDFAEKKNSQVVFEDGCVIVLKKTKKSEKVPPLGGSLKYYKTDFVGKHGSTAALDEDRAELAAKAGSLLALAEDTLESEKLPKAASQFWQQFSNGAHKHTLIYFTDDLSGFGSLVETADQIRAKDNAARLSVYVFVIGSEDVFRDEFDDMRNIDLKPIPEPILNIYKTINGD